MRVDGHKAFPALDLLVLNGMQANGMQLSNDGCGNVS